MKRKEEIDLLFSIRRQHIGLDSIVHMSHTWPPNCYCFIQVNVDVDVPLFLPIYAQRRQHDLRRLAVREVRDVFAIP